MKAQLFYKSENSTGEGALWMPLHSLFLWVDIENGTLYSYSVSLKTIEKKQFSSMVSSIVPFDENNILLFLKEKAIKYNLQTRFEEEWLLFPFLDASLRPNDVKASPDGRIWMGVMHLYNHVETGFLYRINRNLTVDRILENQQIPNGMVWDCSGQHMYYVDSGRRCVECYDYNWVTGEITNKKTVIEVPEELGVPDGMTIDSEGNLWIAHWGGFGVYVWNPNSGCLIDRIEVPVPNVASCTFDSSGQLYITTARSGLSPEELEKYPLSGSVFICNLSIEPGENHYPFKPEEDCL